MPLPWKHLALKVLIAICYEIVRYEVTDRYCKPWAPRHQQFGCGREAGFLHLHARYRSFQWYLPLP